MKTSLYLIICLYSIQALGRDFSAIELSGWSKEQVASDHLRFSNAAKKIHSLHLQVDSYDPEERWDEKSLTEDIKKMASIRKMMSSFLGFKNYQIQSYKHKKMNKLDSLEITGSYLRLTNQLIHFKEINFYQREHFLQLKIVSEGELPSELEIEKLIAEINPEQVEID